MLEGYKIGSPDRDSHDLAKFTLLSYVLSSHASIVAQNTWISTSTTFGSFVTSFYVTRAVFVQQFVEFYPTARIWFLSTFCATFKKKTSRRTKCFPRYNCATCVAWVWTERHASTRPKTWYRLVGIKILSISTFDSTYLVCRCDWSGTRRISIWLRFVQTVACSLSESYDLIKIIHFLQIIQIFHLSK